MIKVIKLMFPYLRPFWKEAVIATLLALPLSAIKALEAYLVKDIFDKGFSPDATFTDALRLALILVGLGVVNLPLRYFHYFGLRQVVDKSTRLIRGEIFRKFQTIPSKFFAQEKQGNLISTIMNDTAVFSEAFKNSLEVIREPLTAASLLGVAFYHDWQLALIIIFTAPLFIITMHYAGKRIRRYSMKTQEDYAEMTHTVGEALGGQKIIKSFGLQSFMVERFEKFQKVFLEHRTKNNSAEEISSPLIEMVGSIAFAGVIIFAHHRITTGQLTTGGFISFVAALAMFMDPVRRFGKAHAKLNQAQAAAYRIFSILDLPEEPHGGKLSFSGFKEKIEFKNVTFSYGDGDVLKNFNLVINKGEKVGLVGLSGSGKSTVVSLLLRLYEVEHGDVLIDGVNIKDYDLKDIRSVFGLVSQDIFLFNDTVRENLTTGDPHSDEEIRNALETSYASEFVKNLPAQLNTSIGDRGLRLSGGQSQRLTIARAFLKDRDVLLFDEATSALDNESEKIVQAALDKVAGHKTVVAVAHRLSTLKDFTRIVVMKDGNKIEEGSHSELMTLNGEYRKLYELSQRD